MTLVSNPPPVFSQIASLREKLNELASASSELTNAASERETQLEAALLSAEHLRTEKSRLHETVEALTARLAEEGSAHQLAEKTAEERHETLRTELQAARAEVDAAATAAAEAAEAAAVAAAKAPVGPEGGAGTSPSRGDADVLLIGEKAGSGSEAGPGVSEENGGGQGEGQSSGERAAAATTGGTVAVGAAVPPPPPTSAIAGAVGDGAGALAATVGAGEPSASERELREEVAALKASLVEAMTGSGAGSSAAVAVGIDGKRSSVAAALESDDVDGELGCNNSWFGLYR